MGVWKGSLPRVLLHLALLASLGLLGWDSSQHMLGADPIRAATLRTGKTALVLLVLSLACTPAYKLAGLRWAIGLRRTLGLYAFTYAAVHVMIFVGVDYQFDPELLRGAVLEKRYALAGLAAFLLLLPLAVTSTGWWRRRLGLNWSRLHRAVYLAALMAVVHYLWLVKADVSQPLQYGVAVLLLMLLRLPAVGRALRLRRAPWLGRN
jgi:sulfoxide reductase heme-binding subunit YedZ